MPSHVRALPARRRARSFAIAIAAAAAVGTAAAAPSDDNDPLSRFVNGAAAAIAPVVGPSADATADGETTASTQPGLLRQVHDRASDMAASAMEFLGIRYRRGGQSAETGFDCSGFTRHVFELSGLDLPRRAEEQARAKGLVPVRLEDLKPGDLVFFNTMKRTFSHVGIYIGENRFVHAPSRGKTVRTDDLGFAYWAKRFTGARRADAATDASPSATVVPVSASVVVPTDTPVQGSAASPTAAPALP